MINHSGGCDGSDMYWEFEGRNYGINTVSYSFYNHVQHGENPFVLTTEELIEGYEHVKIAAKSLYRPLDRIVYPYIKNLISRNWFQVKNADTIFAIGMFDGKIHKKVKGGTGWAVQMAIDNKKVVYFFNQPTNEWHIYSYQYKKFVPYYATPKLTENFAGIGTRELTAFGELAIKTVYEYTFKDIENGRD